MSATPLVITDSRPASAMDRLRHFLTERDRATEPVESLAAFERELRAKVAAVEQEAIARELERFDLDVPELDVDGVRHGRPPGADHEADGREGCDSREGGLAPGGRHWFPSGADGA